MFRFLFEDKTVDTKRENLSLSYMDMITIYLSLDTFQKYLKSGMVESDFTKASSQLTDSGKANLSSHIDYLIGGVLMPILSKDMDFLRKENGRLQKERLKKEKGED